MSDWDYRWRDSYDAWKLRSPDDEYWYLQDPDEFSEDEDPWIEIEFSEEEWWEETRDHQ